MELSWFVFGFERPKRIFMQPLLRLCLFKSDMTPAVYERQAAYWVHRFCSIFFPHSQHNSETVEGE